MLSPRSWSTQTRFVKRLRLVSFQQRPQCFAFLQTTVLVHFEKVSGIQRALKTAAQGKALELQLTEPTEAFGLKGDTFLCASGAVLSQYMSLSSFDDGHQVL